MPIDMSRYGESVKKYGKEATDQAIRDMILEENLAATAKAQAVQQQPAAPQVATHGTPQPVHVPPVESKGILQTAVDTFTGAGARMAQGVNSAAGSMLDAFGLEEGAQAYKEGAEYWDKVAQEAGSTGLPAQIYEGVGAAPLGVAEFVAGPVYAGAKGAVEGYQEGGIPGALEKAAIETTKRIGIGKMFHGIENTGISGLPKAAAMGGTMGVQTAAETAMTPEGINSQDVAASAITGTMLSVTPGKRSDAVRRALIKEGVHPDLVADLASRVPDTFPETVTPGQEATRPPITITDAQGNPLDIPLDTRAPESIGPLISETGAGSVRFAAENINSVVGSKNATGSPNESEPLSMPVQNREIKPGDPPLLRGDTSELESHAASIENFIKQIGDTSNPALLDTIQKAKKSLATIREQIQTKPVAPESLTTEVNETAAPVPLESIYHPDKRIELRFTDTPDQKTITRLKNNRFEDQGAGVWIAKGAGKVRRDFVEKLKSDVAEQYAYTHEDAANHRPLPEPGAELNITQVIEPAASQVLKNAQIIEPGTVEQFTATVKKRGGQEVFDVKLNPSQRRTLEAVRQEISDGEAGKRVGIYNTNEPGSTQVSWGSTFPEYFQNKGYTKTKALAAIDNILNGDGVTAQQRIMVEDMHQARRHQDTNAILTERAKPAEVSAMDLNEGDTLKRNGEHFKVTDVGPDGVTLKDGVLFDLSHEQAFNYDRGTLKAADGTQKKGVTNRDTPQLYPDQVPAVAKGFEQTRQVAAETLNQVYPEGSPDVGLSVKKGASRDDTVNLSADHVDQKGNFKSADNQVEKRWKASNGLNDGPTFMDRTRTFIHKMLSETEHFPELDITTDAGKRTADVLRRFESSAVVSKAKTAEYLHSLTATFGPKKMDVFTRKVILDDLTNEAAKGRGLPFGYTPATLKKDHAAVSKVVDAHPDIKAAVERRAAVNRELVNDLVENGLLPAESVLKPEALERYQKTGEYSPEDINTDYFRHQVLEHANSRRWAGISTGGEVRNKTRGWQKERQGSEKDINTNFLEAEYEVFSQSLKELSTKKALDEVLKENDITAKLKAQAKKEGVEDWKTLIPEDHTAWQPVKGSAFYRGQTMPEEIINRFISENPAFADVAAKFREVTIMGGKKAEVIIPEGLAKTLDKLRTSRDDATLDTINQKMIGGWKVWTLLSPHRVIKYNLNNMSGDMDAAIAADPAIMKHFGTAWKNAWNRKGGRAMSPSEVDMLERGVIDSGISINEIPDIGKLPGFLHLTESGRKTKLLDAIKSGDLSKLAPPNVIAKYFDAVSGITQLREGLLRESAYLRAVELMEKGKKIYWASKPAEIDALPDIKDKAAKLSRELLGDYGNLSAHGERIRTRFIPFASWMEINAPRYARIFKNAAAEGEAGSTAARMAGVGTKKAAGAALGIAEKVFLTQVLFAAVTAFNHLVHPDEEEAMGDADRKQLHAILGTSSDGKVMSVRFQGAFSDALSWFGLEDYPDIYRKIADDKMTAGELAAKMLKATPNKFIGAASPFFKLGAELLTKRSFFPDVFNPKPIRDRSKHTARFLSVDSEYDALTGKPSRGYLDSLKKTIIYEADPGEQAYNTIREKGYKFIEKNGKARGGGEPDAKANALYYHKQAIRYGDKKAADKYLQEYLKEGGKRSKISESINHAAPLASLPVSLRYKFRQSLSPSEQETLKRASAWYRKVYKGGGP